MNSFCSFNFVLVHIFKCLVDRRLFFFPCYFSTGCCYRKSVIIVRQINTAAHTYILNSEYCIFINHTVFGFIFSETWCIFSLSSCIICNGFYGLAGLLQILDVINGNRFPIIQMLFYPLSLIAAFLTHSIVHS